MVRRTTGDTTLGDGFDTAAQRLPGADVAWLTGLRRAGIEAFRAAGLPTRRVEAWKYTNLNALAKLGFEPADEDSSAALDAIPADALALDGACRIVLVNGRLRRDLSDMDRIPDGVTVSGLAETLTRDPASLEGRIAPVSHDRDGALAALNAAFLEDGIVLDFADGAEVATPIHLISVGVPAAGRAVAAYPRNLVVAGRGSRATLVESHVAAGRGPYFSNGVTDVTLQDEAKLTRAKLQNEGSEGFHIALARVSIGNGAVYDGFVLQRGGALSRDEIHASIIGSGAECRLNGAYLGSGRQHIDNTTVIDHRAPGSLSREVYKGVLDERARGVFQGRIVVHRDAQQTNGHQLNKTLLLSRDAEIDTKPELEIYADDVKCSHGATVGELSDAELFYMRSRGIDEATARDMLVSAFVGEAIEQLRDATLVRLFGDYVSGWVEARHRSTEESGA